MFAITHFRSEFIQQGQANIMRRVTMTQFLLAVASAVTGIWLLGAPFWLAPLFIAIGYAGGYSYQGELLVRRLGAYGTVRLRSLAGSPRLVDLQAEWDSVRRQAERRQIGGALPVTVVVD